MSTAIPDGATTPTGFSTTGRTVTEQDIAEFAEASGDHHPQHVDEDWARDSIFGERVAHGMLALSCATGLAPVDPDRIVALRRVDATFKAPVRVGDEIHVEGRFKSARRLSDEFSLATFEWRVRNQLNKVVIRADVEVVWRQPDGTPGENPGSRETPTEGAARP